MKKAKILSFIFALLLLAANAFATTVSIPAITGTDGQTSLVFPINVDSVTYLGGYEFTVTYDPAVLNCTSSARGTLTSTLFEPPTNNFTVPGTGRTLAVMSSGPADGSGDIATMTCTIVGAPGSSTNLTFTELGAHTLLIDGDFAELPATFVSGSFTVFGSSCTPTGPEVCDNVDNDCNGQVDENLTQPNTCGLGACASAGTETCTAGVWGSSTCVPGTPTAEVCDNIDNNCDGTVDSFAQATTCGSGDCAGAGAQTCTAGVWGSDTCVVLTPVTWYRDADGDNYGVNSDTITQCSQPAGYKSQGNDCNDSTTGGSSAARNRGVDIYPGSTYESATICNGKDNDCDGTIDEAFVPVPVTCGIGACQAAGQQICLVPDGFTVIDCVPNAPTQEGPAGNASCFDGIDNDCDGSADAADVDCEQPETVSIPTDLVGINGNTVNIPVNVGDASGIAGYQFGINYNPAVLDCTDAAAGSLTGGFDAPTVNATIPGYINVLSIDPDLNELSGGTGSLVSLVCTVVGTDPAATDLTFDESTLMDSNTDEIPSVPLPGHFSVTDCIPTGAEVCDGLDNNCNGTIDEGMNTTSLKETCGVGACMRLKQRICQGASGWVDACTPGTPGVEGPVGDATCSDGKDNDCDGTSDASDTSSCQQPAAAAKVAGMGSTANGTLSLSVNTMFPSKGWLKYSAQSISLQSTKISSASVAGTTATVTGTASVNGAAGCGFTAAVTDGTPDTMGIVITPGGACTTSHTEAPAATTSGFFTIQ